MYCLIQYEQIIVYLNTNDILKEITFENDGIIHENTLNNVNLVLNIF